MLPICSMYSLVDVRSKSKIDAFTYILLISAAFEHCRVAQTSRKILQNYYGPTECEHAARPCNSERA